MIWGQIFRNLSCTNEVSSLDLVPDWIKMMWILTRAPWDWRSVLGWYLSSGRDRTETSKIELMGRGRDKDEEIQDCPTYPWFWSWFLKFKWYGSKMRLRGGSYQVHETSVVSSVLLIIARSKISRGFICWCQLSHFTARPHNMGQISQGDPPSWPESAIPISIIIYPYLVWSRQKKPYNKKPKRDPYSTKQDTLNILLNTKTSKTEKSKNQRMKTVSFLSILASTNAFEYATDYGKGVTTLNVP